MIVLPLIAGGATLVASGLVFRLWLGMLPRSVCPECGELTILVSHALSSGVGRWLSRRWCAACDWAGWGRRGPVLWRKKGPVADGSGFRWGQDRLQLNFGFRWKARPSAERPARVHHPSGFRFTEDPVYTLTTAETPESSAHPSGFRFRGAPSPPQAPAGDHPTGFSWGVSKTEQAAHFRWKT